MIEAEKTRKIKFVKHHRELEEQLEKENLHLTTQQNENLELTRIMAELSSELDSLILEAEAKNRMLEERDVEVRTAKCDHVPLIK